jgi:hypothetical protein
MSFLSDLRSFSESAVEQLASRVPALPRPLLAAIGAGDLAAERLAELGSSLGSALPGGGTRPLDLRAMTVDLPARAQKVAADAAESLEKFAARAPGRAQEFAASMPDKMAEIGTLAQQFSQDNVRKTVDGYSRLAAVVYGNLAERGGQTWSRVRSSGPRPGTVVDAVQPAGQSSGVRSAPAEKSAVTPVAAKAPVSPSGDSTATLRASVAKAASRARTKASTGPGPEVSTPGTAEPGTATPRGAAARTAAPGSAEPRTATPRGAAARTAAPGSAEPRTATPRGAASRGAPPRSAEAGTRASADGPTTKITSGNDGVRTTPGRSPGTSGPNSGGHSGSPTTPDN